MLRQAIAICIFMSLIAFMAGLVVGHDIGKKTDGFSGKLFEDRLKRKYHQNALMRDYN